MAPAEWREPGAAEHADCEQISFVTRDAVICMCLRVNLISRPWAVWLLMVREEKKILKINWWTTFFNNYWIKQNPWV